MGVILCEFESRPPHPNEKRKIERFSSFSFFLIANSGLQPVDVKDAVEVVNLVLEDHCGESADGVADRNQLWC